MLDTQIKINSPHYSQQAITPAQGENQQSSTHLGNNMSQLQTQGNQNIDSYFFEADEVSLRKIDGIRLSLCMTIKIVYKITTAKKKAWCQALLDHEVFGDVYKFLNAFIE